MRQHPRLSSLIISASLLLALFQPSVGLTQQQSARLGVDELFRKAGISKGNQGKAPDFTLRETNGNTASLGGQRGNLVFLNFWATWCGPCRQEMPSMERLYRELGGQGLTMLAVNEKESGAQVSNFMRNYGLSFPALLDVDGRVLAAYRVWGLPTTFLIDANGSIIGMKSGPKEWAAREVVDALRSLLGERGSVAGVAGSLLMGPVAQLPSGLRVKNPGSSLHAQQDSLSELITKLARGDELVVLGNASSAGEAWYMTRTKSGFIGWIKASDVEEATSPIRR
jgi:peroxiredoxin